MENRFDFTTAVVAVCVAGYVAIMLNYVAHDDLGFSLVQIREGAVIAAALLAMPLALHALRTTANKTDKAE
jgi:ABC-type molybdate transport system permease subunit